jgi:hypothetical protein
MNKRHKAVEKALYNSLYDRDSSHKMWNESTPQQRNMRRLAILRAQCLSYRRSDLGFDPLALIETIRKSLPTDKDVQLGHALDYRQF